MYLIDAIDWLGSFLPAIHLWLNGQSPYLTTFYNVPWTLFVLLPFAALPYELGRALLFIVSLTAFVYVTYRLGARRNLVFIVLSLPVFLSLVLFGNVEWIALLGLVSAPPISFFLLLVKPQMTICVILFSGVELYRNKQYQTLKESLILLFGALALSFIFFGLWVIKLASYASEAPINYSLFPYLLPLGIGLFVASLKYRKMNLALAASPFFFPTLTPQVYLVVVLALASLPLPSLFAFVGSWFIVAFKSL